VQLVVPFAWHWPWAMQVLGLVKTALAHEPSLHTVPTAYLRHAPTPSQTPSLPQLAEPWSAHSPSGSLPVVTGAQVPSFPPVNSALQLVQVPVQALSQQTPSTHWPLAHCEALPG